MSDKSILHYLLVKILILKVFAEISVVDEGVLPLQKNSIGLKFFVDIENLNRIKTCEIYSSVDKCCLTDLDKEDCDTMDVVGESVKVIKPRDRETFIYVFPTLYQHDLIGYCDITLNYTCIGKRNKMHVNIPFDTIILHSKRYTPLLENYLKDIKIVPCETLDQNSLDHCLPIICNQKYADERSFYDKSINRCIKTPVCVGDFDKDLPRVVYVPHINICKSFELPLTAQDIYAITNGLGTITQPVTKEDDFKVEITSNCSTISQNLYLLRDLLYGKLCPCDENTKVNFEDGCKSAIVTIVFCVISICAVLLSFVFCVNTTVWVQRQWSRGNINAFMLSVKSKFKRSENKNRKCRINSEIRNNLLREVIIKDIPLELRDSVVSICDRMEKEVRKKKRYRNEDIGSQISLQKAEHKSVLTSSSTDTLCSEREPFLK